MTAAVFALGAPAAPLLAQGFPVMGVVQRVGRGDTVPLPGVWVVLHQVTLAGGAPVDSARTGSGGRYRLRAGRLDTTAVYLVSVSYAGIAYFSRPVRPIPGAAATAEQVEVFDTSSTTPLIRLAQRHLVVRKPEADGSRRVLELLVLQNDGWQTRISPDTTRPVWQGALPRGVVQFEVGESDVSSQAVLRRANAVAVTAPVPPGEKQVLVSYVLPATVGLLDVVVDQVVGQFNVLVEDSASVLESNALAAAGSEVIEGVRFARYESHDLEPGTRVMLRFLSRRGVRFDALWWLVVGLAGVALLGGLVVVWRRAAQPAPALASDDAEVLAAQIAALDAAFESRDLSDEAKQTYQRTRDAFKARLERALGRR